MNSKSMVKGGLPHGRLINKRLAAENGRLSKQKFSDAVEKQTENSIRLQTNARITYLTDGLYRWDDLFAPFCNGGLTNVERGSLIRFFDNNTYYRRPRINGPVKFSFASTRQWFERACSKTSSSKLKVHLPGPATFSLLSEDMYYHDFEAMCGTLAEALRLELAELLKMRPGIVEITDPSLGQMTPAQLEAVRKSYEDFVHEAECKTVISTPFTPLSSFLLRWLKSMSNVYVSADLSSTTLHGGDCVNDAAGTVSGAISTIDALAQNGIVAVDLGILDSRNTLLEPRAMVEKIVAYTLGKRMEDVIVSNNATLDFLPEKVAYEKVKLLGKSVSSIGAEKH